MCWHHIYCNGDARSALILNACNDVLLALDEKRVSVCVAGCLSLRLLLVFYLLWGHTLILIYCPNVLQWRDLSGFTFVKPIAQCFFEPGRTACTFFLFCCAFGFETVICFRFVVR